MKLTLWLLSLLHVSRLSLSALSHVDPTTKYIRFYSQGKGGKISSKSWNTINKGLLSSQFFFVERNVNHRRDKFVREKPSGTFEFATLEAKTPIHGGSSDPRPGGTSSEVAFYIPTPATPTQLSQTEVRHRTNQVIYQSACSIEVTWRVINQSGILYSVGV